MATAFAASYPFVLNADDSQERVKGLIQLAAGTSYANFLQQLAQRVGLPANQLQVVIACSRANEFEQLQKIPIHEGTNFNVILTQHNPGRDKNVHFIVQPKMSPKQRIIAAQRKAMEAARADEEAANRASSTNNSPRFVNSAEGNTMLARLAQAGALNGKLGAGLLPQYNVQAFNRNMVLAAHGNGWTPPATTNQVMYKPAVPINYSTNVVPQARGRPSPTPSPPAPGIENRAPVFDGPLTGTGTMRQPRVTPFPEGMLRQVHAQHSGAGEFWRTSPRDRMVMGFRGPSPFGPVGTKIRAA